MNPMILFRSPVTMLFVSLLLHLICCSTIFNDGSIQSVRATPTPTHSGLFSVPSSSSSLLPSTSLPYFPLQLQFFDSNDANSFHPISYVPAFNSPKLSRKRFGNWSVTDQSVDEVTRNWILARPFFAQSDPYACSTITRITDATGEHWMTNTSTGSSTNHNFASTNSTPSSTSTTIPSPPIVSALFLYVSEASFDCPLSTKLNFAANFDVQIVIFVQSAALGRVGQTQRPDIDTVVITNQIFANATLPQTKRIPTRLMAAPTLAQQEAMIPPSERPVLFVLDTHLSLMNSSNVLLHIPITSQCNATEDIAMTQFISSTMVYSQMGEWLNQHPNVPQGGNNINHVDPAPLATAIKNKVTQQQQNRVNTSNSDAELDICESDEFQGVFCENGQIVSFICDVCDPVPTQSYYNSSLFTFHYLTRLDFSTPYARSSSLNFPSSFSSYPFLTHLDLTQRVTEAPLTTTESPEADLQTITGSNHYTYVNAPGLVGALPADLFSSSPYLINLWVEGNQASGLFPSLSVNQSCALQSIVLNTDRNWWASSNFQRSFSTEIFRRCDQLRRIAFFNTAFTGEIPFDFNLTYLQDWLIAGNSFTASLERTHLSNLMRFSNQGAISNYFGSIPSSFYLNTPNMLYIDVSGNQFHGILDPAIGTWKSIYHIDIRSNLFQGTLPNELGKLTELQFLGLGNNYFEGVLPLSLTNLQQLVRFDVRSMALSGTVPCLSPFTIQTLYVSLNSFTGVDFDCYPDDPNAFALLNELALLNNPLGSIPNGTHRLTAITNLDFTWTNLTRFQYQPGSDTLLALPPRLKTLDFTSNQLEGAVPMFSVQPFASTLTTLALTMNSLTSAPIDAFDNMPYLQSLDLSLNSIASPLPSFKRTKSLTELKLNGNRFTDVNAVQMSQWNLPQVSTLLLMNNALTHLSSLANAVPSLEKVNLSANAFDLPVIDALNSLPLQTVIIDLSYNHLTGPLVMNPLSYYRYNIIYLSHNDISEIPSLDQVPIQVKLLDVSFQSNLKGKIDLGLFFPTVSNRALNIEGNPQLRALPTAPRPSWLVPTAASVSTATYSCSLYGIDPSLHLVWSVVLDPALYNYDLCVCIRGTYGEPPNCIPIPAVEMIATNKSRGAGAGTQVASAAGSQIVDSKYGNNRYTNGMDLNFIINAINIDPSNMPTNQTETNVTMNAVHGYSDMGQYSSSYNLQSSSSIDQSIIVNTYGSQPVTTPKPRSTFSVSSTVDRDQILQDNGVASSSDMFTLSDSSIRMVAISLRFNLTVFSSFTDIIEIYENGGDQQGHRVANFRGNTMAGMTDMLVYVNTPVATLSFRSRALAGEHFTADIEYLYDCIDKFEWNHGMSRCVKLYEQNDYVFILGITVALIAATMSFVSLLVLFRYRDLILIRSANVPFCSFMLISCIALSFGAILYVTPISSVSSSLCDLRIWCTALPFVSVISALWIKALQIQSIFINQHLKTDHLLTTKQTFLLLAACMAIEIFLLFIFSISNMSTPVSETFIAEADLYTFLRCPSLLQYNQKFIVWTVCQISLGVLLVFLCVHTAIRIRKVPTAFNESSNVAHSIFVLTLLMILFVPLTHFLNPNPDAVDSLMSLMQSAVAIVLVSMIFIPKFTYLATGEGDDSKLMRNESMQEFERHVSRSKRRRTTVNNNNGFHPAITSPKATSSTRAALGKGPLTPGSRNLRDNSCASPFSDTESPFPHFNFDTERSVTIQSGFELTVDPSSSISRPSEAPSEAPAGDKTRYLSVTKGSRVNNSFSVSQSKPSTVLFPRDQPRSESYSVPNRQHDESDAQGDTRQANNSDSVAIPIRIKPMELASRTTRRDSLSD